MGLSLKKKIKKLDFLKNFSRGKVLKLLNVLCKEQDNFFHPSCVVKEL